MNKFGGNWTIRKMKIVEEYAKAYLKIMSKNKYWDLLYFDAMAGSGTIELKRNFEVLSGMAIRILELEEPIPFDEYYFVELSKTKTNTLEQKINVNFPNKKIHIVNEDCNKKLKDLSNFLQSEKGKKYRVLAFVDPTGMQVDWESLKGLGKSGIDLWLLIPTGSGANRLLKNDGNISKSWIERLNRFLGMTEEEIRREFYIKPKQLSLIDTNPQIIKTKDAIQKLANLYKSRLEEIFDHVSKPLPLKDNGKVLFHFIFVSQNKNACKIANDILKNNM